MLKVGNVSGNPKGRSDIRKIEFSTDILVRDRTYLVFILHLIDPTTPCHLQLDSRETEPGWSLALSKRTMLACTSLSLSKTSMHLQI